MSRRTIIILIVLLLIAFKAGKNAVHRQMRHDIQYTTTTQTYDTMQECENDPAMLICTEEQP